MKAVLIKLALSLLGDEKTRKKLLIAVLSVIVGLLGMMCLPFIILHSMNKIGVPEISTSAVDQTQFLTNIDTEKTAELEDTGQTIANAMSVIGLQEQTIKSQLIYLSFFEDKEISDFSQYAEIFSCPDDRTLIDSLNETYNLNIRYEDFMRSYTMVMNAIINPYLFTNTTTKNASDLAAWARNAYVSDWGFASGARGEMDSELGYRYADNVGLLLGYLNYHLDEKLFSNDYDTLFYTEQGTLDTMPDVAGIGVFNGEEFGVYAGNGEVIFCSESVGHTEKTILTCGIWTSWCTFDAVEYPQEVWDAIQALQPEESEENEEIYDNESEELADEN